MAANPSIEGSEMTQDKAPDSSGESPWRTTNATGAAEAEVGRYVYRRIEALMDAAAFTPEGDELQYLATIAESVEEYGEEACGASALSDFPSTSAAGAALLKVLQGALAMWDPTSIDSDWNPARAAIAAWNLRASPPSPPAVWSGEDSLSQSQPCGDGAQPILPPVAEPSASEGMGYDAGSVVWHSSDEEGGPDVGIQLGLGSGFSLYFGELPTQTLEEHDIDLKTYPDGWWAVLYGPKDQWIFGAVPDHYRAQEVIEHITGCVQALSPIGAAPDSLSVPQDEPENSPSPLPRLGDRKP